MLSLETNQPGSEFGVGAVGLSMEAAELNRGRLTASHYRLVRFMRLLGPAVLRIGGGTVDRSWWTSTDEQPPSWAASTVTPADLYLLRGLLDATRWKVILGVNFGHFEPTRAADEARYARAILGNHLMGVEIGNEPDGYVHKPNNLRSTHYMPGEYLLEAQAYRRAVVTAAPGVGIYGPSLSETKWLAAMGSSASMFTELTQHYYPIYEVGACPVAPSSAPLPTAAELLSPVTREREDNLLQALTQAADAAGRPARVGETNSVPCRPNVYANPGFAGSLWALDWALRAVNSGVRGINFQGGPYPCLLYPESPICAPGDGALARAGDVTAQPEYYGLLAARQLEGGRFVPTHLTTSSPDITTWATIAPDRTIRIAIDDLATVGTSQAIYIPIAGKTATVERLTAHSTDADSGISLGGVELTDTGRWRPRPSQPVRVGRFVRILVRPTSAVIVVLRPTPSGG